MSTLNITPLKDWGFNFGKPVIISGPCSAETEEQVMSTALLLGDKGIDILRAGIWKPRTRPGMFEGIGAEGLVWLKNAGQAIGKPVAVEVATSQHVEECLKAGIDILWIGARTTVNPFSVQDIADALKGVNVPVAVKNPINPDLQLWIGALERINKAGITKLAAIHRGFSSYEQSKFRNQPKWELPIELRRLFPDIPIFNDPSHICGSREFIPEIAQIAVDLDFDGLMIESHCDPTNAWSDAAQQVTPDRLGEILNDLVIRRKINPNTTDNKLENLRSTIDRIDNYVLELMSERMDIARQIGEYKKEKEITILQTSRWDEIVNSRIKTGRKKQLSEEFVKSVFEAIHQESINHQNQVMNVDKLVEK